MPREKLERDVRMALEPSVADQQVLLRVYRDDTKAAQVRERFVDLDEGVQQVALSPREDGGEDDRGETRHPWLGGRAAPHDVLSATDRRAVRLESP